ncbi:MAG: pyruvate phosphate dikinase [Frankiales bacterium]|nr:pyruvate phosphate dikinase [Frankiales bacterium]
MSATTEHAVRRPGPGGTPLVVRLDGTAGLPKAVLGNKGFGIDAMRRHGLPVPPAFALTTEVCRTWEGDPRAALEAVWPQVLEGLAWLEQETGRTFGSGPRPLLVSVRSGAAVSMPGMMDTVLDLGIDDAVEAALAADCGAAFATDTRQRFEAMYRRIVMSEVGLDDVPTDPHVQLRAAIGAVFASWQSPRAVTYRTHQGLPDDAGTAVVVQAMVFGNLPSESGTGVLFSRNPLTGAPEPLGEWLPGGQGEDVVSGTHDCQRLSDLAVAMPTVHDRLLSVARQLEGLATDVQDIEFTVEEGRLWLLQTRVAKRSAQAAVRLALAFVDECAIDERTALSRISPEQLRCLLLPGLQPEDRLAAPLLASGLAACPGVASGRVVDDPDDAVDAADAGEQVVLVRSATSPDDVHGMLAATAVVTELGGPTSHAAVVSRELGRPAVVGCGLGVVDALLGRTVTVDGTSGEVREGVLPLVAWSETDDPALRRLAAWARTHAPLVAHAPSHAPAGAVPLTAATAEAVSEALARGSRDVVSESPLLVMLHALALRPTEPGRTS